MASDNLVPFTSDTARAAGRKGVDARRAKRIASAGTTSDIAGNLATVAATFKRGELGPNAAAAANWVVARVVAGQVPIRNAGEAADLLRVLVDVARLENGDATSVALVGHVSTSAEMAARLAELRSRAAATEVVAPVLDVDSVEVGDASAAAVAVADPPPSVG